MGAIGANVEPDSSGEDDSDDDQESKETHEEVNTGLFWIYLIPNCR